MQQTSLRARLLQGGALVALLSGLLVAGDVGIAAADAPDPMLSTTTGSVTDSSAGPILTLNGGWQWTTHHSDCNFDKRAVGYAVDWNDASQPGNVVATVDQVTVDVGAAAANPRNPADNNVHPTPATSIANPGFGGCGTYADPPGYNSGTWGPISHTYPPGTTEFNVCVVTYDVHLADNGGAPNGTKETTAGGSGHNGDNGVEKNSATPLGNGCFMTKITLPKLSTRASGPVTLGGSIHDTASLTGGDNPTGTITFDLYGPDDATCQGPAQSVTTSVSGNGDYPSDPITPSQAGTYRWIARYSGDIHNSPVAGACNDPNESVTVTPPSNASLTTKASGSVPVGGWVKDTATLTGAANPTGTITFALYGPDDATCAGPATTVNATSPVNGNGSYVSPSVKVTAAGTYRWIASYSGDGNNAAVSGACNDPNESVVVTEVLIHTKQFLIPNDSMTLTNGAGATGNVVFKLYGPNNPKCAGTPDYQESQPISGGSATTTNSTFFASTPGTWRWVVVYPGDANHPRAVSGCGREKFTIVDG